MRYVARSLIMREIIADESDLRGRLGSGEFNSWVMDRIYEMLERRLQ